MTIVVRVEGLPATGSSEHLVTLAATLSRQVQDFALTGAVPLIPLVLFPPDLLIRSTSTGLVLTLELDPVSEEFASLMPNSPKTTRPGYKVEHLRRILTKELEKFSNTHLKGCPSVTSRIRFN